MHRNNHRKFHWHIHPVQYLSSKNVTSYVENTTSAHYNHRQTQLHSYHCGGGSDNDVDGGGGKKGHHWSQLRMFIIYMGNLLTTCFEQNGSSSGNTYIKTYWEELLHYKLLQ